MNVIDPAFAAEQTRIFVDDLARSKVVSLEAWRARPWRERVGDRLGSMLGSQL